MTVTVDTVLESAGTGRYQRALLGIFGLVWAADAMQVLAVGFSAASIAASFGLTVPVALQTGTLFFLGMMFIVLSLPVTIPIVIAADKFAALLRKSPRVTRIVDYLFAGVFSAFALKILTAQAK